MSTSDNPSSSVIEDHDKAYDMETIAVLVTAYLRLEVAAALGREGIKVTGCDGGQAQAVREIGEKLSGRRRSRKL
ncbi:hypothetical protein LTR97_002479 [Elasticomyces elasticus]|uniref:Uncharacterized protein n=1 Tax=Elasticomyces elasticus TaxID=574655 RepID=A0AAN7VW86_9PEZI|nr:hypothetical protein LTR97_002479 [Elasticomyces elasticus]